MSWAEASLASNRPSGRAERVCFSGRKVSQQPEGESEGYVCVGDESGGKPFGASGQQHKGGQILLLLLAALTGTGTRQPQLPSTLAKAASFSLK